MKKKRKEKKPAASGAAPELRAQSAASGNTDEHRGGNVRGEQASEHQAGGRDRGGRGRGGSKGNRKWAGAMDGGSGRRQLCGAGGGWGSEVKVTLSRVAGAAATGGEKKKLSGFHLSDATG